MARTFTEQTVTFRRTVTQEQEIVVKVPPEVSGKLATEYAEAVAWKRLTDKGWEIVTGSDRESGKPEIVR